jgi:hypothetical protein
MRIYCVSCANMMRMMSGVVRKFMVNGFVWITDDVVPGAGKCGRCAMATGAGKASDVNRDHRRDDYVRTLNQLDTKWLSIDSG